MIVFGGRLFRNRRLFGQIRWPNFFSVIFCKGCRRGRAVAMGQSRRRPLWSPPAAVPRWPPRRWRRPGPRRTRRRRWGRLTRRPGSRGTRRRQWGRLTRRHYPRRMRSLFWGPCWIAPRKSRWMKPRRSRRIKEASGSGATTAVPALTMLRHPHQSPAMPRRVRTMPLCFSGELKVKSAQILLTELLLHYSCLVRAGVGLCCVSDHHLRRRSRFPAALDALSPVLLPQKIFSPPKLYFLFLKKCFVGSVK